MSLVADNSRPFEWLTSSESVIPLINSLDLPEDRLALHVGCGSSTMGEVLISELNFQFVLNIDKDRETLEGMKERWAKVEAKYPQKKMKFRCVDWMEEEDCTLQKTFNVILDKSTLDCTLCSDRSTAGLIKLVHDHLSVGGYYIIISFHDVQLLLPMLQNCPGTKWKVSHNVMTREVEDLISKKKRSLKCSHASLNESNKKTSESQTVNVIICQKFEVGNNLSVDIVQRHVNQTNDTWFQSLNPLLSKGRRRQLQRSFSGNKDLKHCYKELFTDLERESLTYEFFLQDWDAYCQTRPSISKTSMSLETALDFLQEMQ